MENINREQIEKLMKESNVFCILPFKHTLLQPRGTATLCCMNPDSITKDDKPIRWEEVDFEKVQLPSQVKRFLGKFVQSMKDANLNRLKRSAILYKVIEAAGMSPQQLMADIQKIKKEM